MVRAFLRTLMRLILAILVVLAFNSVTSAQFRLRQQSTGCPNGQCALPSTTYRTSTSSYATQVIKQPVVTYTLAPTKPVVSVVPVIVGTTAPEDKLVKEVEVLPKELTINGVRYFRH